MEVLKPPRFFKNARQKVDTTLNEERDRADCAFEASWKMAEHGADEELRISRLRADQARARRRGIGRIFPLGKAKVLSVQQEDDAIQAERTRMDTVLRRERTLKDRLVSTMIHFDREASDTTLNSERSTNDLEVLHSKGLLVAERTAHRETRQAITTRDEFLAIVSHDLRSPMSNISSCGEMLLEDPSFLISEEARSWIGVMKRTADSGLRLIRDILDVERIAEGKLQLKMTTFEVDPILRETVEEFTQIAAVKPVLLRTLPEEGAKYVTADRDRIAQVLSNFVGNAIKFTPAGGFVTLRTQCVEGKINFLIEDTGPGISQEQQEHIFERFAQLENKDRTGLGLGLYISKMLIQAHNGELGLHSEVGKGSTFFFTLPKAGTSHVCPTI